MNVTVRRRLAAAAVIAAAPAISACGVNFGAQTDQIYNPTVGTDDRSGTVDVINALIVSGKHGSGTVVAGLVNNSAAGSDRLVSVAGAGKTADVQVSVGGPTKIPARGLLNLAKDGKVTATGSSIVPGKFVTLTWSFQRGKSVTFDAPVVAASSSAYKDVPLPSSPSSASKPSSGPSASASASPGA
ncbi:MAG: hypothetical protein ACXVEU_20030 [Nocardioidaceae bacterium]